MRGPYSEPLMGKKEIHREFPTGNTPDEDTVARDVFLSLDREWLSSREAAGLVGIESNAASGYLKGLYKAGLVEYRSRDRKRIEYRLTVAGMALRDE